MCVEAIGFYQDTHADEAFVLPVSFVTRHQCNPYFRPSARGDEVRDWTCRSDEKILFPYNESIEQWSSWPESEHLRWAWPLRTTLWGRSVFGGQTYRDAGRPWWDYHQFPKDRARSSHLIAFAEVATHNHFVLDRGGKVFNRTAPVIKLPAGASDDEHLALLGLLNSSVACFWMKQVSHQKQMMGGDGIRISSKAKVPYQFSGTQLKQLPIPNAWESGPLRRQLIELAKEADRLAASVAKKSAESAVKEGLEYGLDVSVLWNEFVEFRRKARTKLILIQEDIDFLCYQLYGLHESAELLGCGLEWEVEIEAGERPFCIRSQENQEGFKVPTDVPGHWPTQLRALWYRRIEAIENSPYLKLIEDPHYKRRWIGRQGLFNHDARANEFSDALRGWLLDRLEDARYWPEPAALTTTHKLTDRVRLDPEFMQVAGIYTGRDDFDVAALVAALAASESVPLLPVLRYSETGLRKREAWEQTWEMQRREDAIDAEVSDEEERKRRKRAEIGDIPVPPKYQNKDFQKTDYWRLRGGLAVPKERFVSFPHCSKDADGSLVIAWAGWNPLQLALAIAGHYQELKDYEGWPAERLTPLIAGIAELVPWIKQWHDDPDPIHGNRMGDYLDTFVDDEAKTLGLTRSSLSAWQPPVVRATRRKRS